MRSPGDGWRIAMERLLRAASVLLLAWMLFWSLRPVRSENAPVQIGSPSTVRDSLPVWSVSAFSDSIHLEVDTVPDREMRDWLVALRRSGARLSWSGARVPATAVATSPVGSPAGGARIRVAAPAGARVEITDGLGMIDSVTARGGGASLRVRGVAMPVSALVEGQLAGAMELDSLALRRVVVIGRADWESKFVIAALEESGWAVDAICR